MKKILISIFAMFGLATAAVAQEIAVMGGQVTVSNLDIAHNGEKLFISMNMDISGLNLKSDHEVVLTPMLTTLDDTLRLPQLVVAGRNRYYVRLRNEKQTEERKLYRWRKSSLPIFYQASTDYRQWMEQAELSLNEDLCGCGNLLTANNDPLNMLDFKPRVFAPVYIYLPPQAEAVKMRELRGQAYIDFPVSRTEIYEDYRNNPVELGKILATIDTVKNDPDTRITAMSFKGYASPESPYSNNTRLAKGRTETLKRYVQSLYHFPDSIITTDYEPEDWAGLWAYVEKSGLQHRNEILALIDSDREPDAKEWKIKSTYPEEYRFLLQNCYPALRHSDYRVEYVVRSYTDVEEARRIMKTAPGKLSLQEMYLVANSYEPGSEDYNETFEIMVRLYPDDAVANLNAANVAMAQGNLKNARRYLAKAGDDRLAVYARGLAAALEADYETARTCLKQAEELGVAEATGALRQLEEVETHNNRIGRTQ